MNTNKLSVKSILVSLSLALFGVTGFAACAAPMEPNEEAVSAGEEQVGEAQGAISRCCPGFYYCEATGRAFNYISGQPRCRAPGMSTPGAAYIACSNACSDPC